MLSVKVMLSVRVSYAQVSYIQCLEVCDKHLMLVKLMQSSPPPPPPPTCPTTPTGDVIHKGGVGWGIK